MQKNVKLNGDTVASDQCLKTVLSQNETHFLSHIAQKLLVIEFKNQKFRWCEV